MEGSEEELLKAISGGDAAELMRLVGGLSLEGGTTLPTTQTAEEALLNDNSAEKVVESKGSCPANLGKSVSSAEKKPGDLNHEKRTRNEEIEGLEQSAKDESVDIEAYNAAVSAWEDEFPSLNDQNSTISTVEQQVSGADYGPQFLIRMRARSLKEAFPWVSTEMVDTVLSKCKGNHEVADKMLSIRFPKPSDWVSEHKDMSISNSETVPYPVSRTKGIHQWVDTGESVASLYQKYRGEASDLARLRNVCFQNAATANAAGNGAAARAHASKGRAYNEQMKEKHWLAAEAIFNSRNPNGISSGQLDLHGLHVNEAIQRLEFELESAEAIRSVRILTGSGHHSRGIHNAPRLRPAVERFLRDRGYRFEAIEDSNRYVGAFRVLL